MDTGTHLVFGLGLAGLAYVDPIVASDAGAATAVFIGTVVGSQAPDFDGLFRFKGNAAYIKNHRGITHSLPAIAIWTLLLTSGIKLFFTDVPWLTIGMWVLLAVSLHVFSDLFNTYGTQAFRPFTQKWISWNIIHIFDPFIFGTHIAAISLWLFQLAEPQTVFPILYTAIAAYYIWRTTHHAQLSSQLPSMDKSHDAGDEYLLIPTVHLRQWNIVKTKSDGTFVLGELKQGKLQWIDMVRCSDHPAVEISRKHPDIASFLYFSSYACAETQVHNWGYEVRWIDVRYRHRKQYPFVGVLLMDRDFHPIDSYVGWLNNERIEKKLRMDSF